MLSSPPLRWPAESAELASKKTGGLFLDIFLLEMQISTNQLPPPQPHHCRRHAWHLWHAAHPLACRETPPVVIEHLDLGTVIQGDVVDGPSSSLRTRLGSSYDSALETLNERHFLGWKASRSC